VVQTKDGGRKMAVFHLPMKQQRETTTYVSSAGEEM